MPFGLLFQLLLPLITKVIQVLLPWLVDIITADVKAGRETTISEADIKQAVISRKEAIRQVYRGS